MVHYGLHNIKRQIPFNHGAQVCVCVCVRGILLHDQVINIKSKYLRTQIHVSLRTCAPNRWWIVELPPHIIRETTCAQLWRYINNFITTHSTRCGCRVLMSTHHRVAAGAAVGAVAASVACPLVAPHRMHTGTLRQWLDGRKNTVRLSTVARPDHSSQQRNQFPRYVNTRQSGALSFSVCLFGVCVSHCVDVRRRRRRRSPMNGFNRLQPKMTRQKIYRVIRAHTCRGQFA